MKRNEFLKEMSSSFGKTLKGIWQPMIEEDVVKLTNAAHQIMGVKWHYLCRNADLQAGIEQKFISGKPILVIKNQDGNVQTLSGICSVCSNLLIYTALYSTGKCLICEKEYNFNQQQGTLIYTELPLKYDQDKIYVGIGSTIKK